MVTNTAPNDGDDIVTDKSTISNSIRPLEEGEETVDTQPRKKTRFKFLEKKIFAHQKKIINPFVKLFGHTKIAQALRGTEHALFLNSHAHGKTFSPILYGFESLRPYRNYKMQEIEDNKSKENEDKSDNEKLDLPKMSMYKIGDDPIQFVQNFLVAVNESSETPSRTAIFRTFISLLDPVVASDFKAWSNEDPDDAIEKFICQRTRWSHLAKNIVDAQKYINWYYDHSTEFKAGLTLKETMDWILTEKRVRPIRVLNILSQNRKNMFDAQYNDKLYDPSFKPASAIFDFCRSEIKARKRWWDENGHDMDIIERIAEITKETLMKAHVSTDYIQVPYEELLKLLETPKGEVTATETPTPGTKLNEQSHFGTCNLTSREFQGKPIPKLRGKFMSPEEWLNDRPTIKRANQFLQTSFHKNPYAHYTTYMEKGRHFTPAAFRYFRTNGRCTKCGLKIQSIHQCVIQGEFFGIGKEKT
ncbi:hypothetical protein DAKH74_056560 [Maudiozyma humilis]|uniref:Uncharacterized protein n=1 Tax=Maudiozyma humilis TaxID=51915 RepID=A0AAV5S597_MAUHU|nr:hypothetical protein DAKH74_056560 [Kazachstania humilis]